MITSSLHDRLTVSNTQYKIKRSQQLNRKGLLLESSSSMPNSTGAACWTTKEFQEDNVECMNASDLTSILFDIDFGLFIVEIHNC